MRNNIGYDRGFVEKLNKYGICVNYSVEQTTVEDKFIESETYELRLGDVSKFARIYNERNCAIPYLINECGVFNQFSFEELIEILKIIDDKIDELNKTQTE